MKKNLFPICMLFLLSGFSGLVYQVVWLRMLTLVFGSTVFAVSTLLTAFMGGLALGSLLLGRVSHRLASPLKTYGLMELAIGAYAAATPWIFKIFDGLYVVLYQHSEPGSAGFTVLRFVLAILLLILPTALMGGTLPVLARHAIPDSRQTSSKTGLLYSANTAGAVLGCASAGFLLIPTLGLRRSIFLAAAVNVVVFLAALVLERYGTAAGAAAARPAGESAAVHAAGTDTVSVSPAGRMPAEYADLKRHPIPDPGEGRLNNRLRRTFLILFFFTGMASLAYEVYWTRILVLYMGSSVYAYSVMLTALLLGIAVGSLLAAPISDRMSLKSLVTSFALVEMAIGFSIILQITQFTNLSEMMGNLSVAFGPRAYWKMALVFFFIAGQVILIPSVLMGASFPLALRAVAGPLKRVSRDVGDLYSVNTMGAILGSFAAGFLLIPLLGVQKSMLATALVNILAGGVALMSVSWSRKAVTGAAAAGLSAVAVFLLLYSGLCRPNQVLLSAGIFNHSGIKRLLHFEEDVNATITVEELRDARGDWRSISLNGVNVAGTSIDLITVQKMQGHLPLLVHGHAKKVLHIGFGSGGTARSVSCYPVEKIQVAEISPGVVTTSQRFFSDVNDCFWIDDDRVEIEYCDGRNYVLASPERFDVILSDSIHPKFAGNGSLYTLEYYRLCRRKLNPGGVVSQWLPFYSLTDENLKMIIRSFQTVFPETYVFYVNSTVNPFTIVIGRDSSEKLDVGRIAELLDIPEVNEDLGSINQAGVVRLLDNFLFGTGALQNFVSGVPLHTDDWPAVEYYSARQFNRTETWRVNFEDLVRHRESVLPYLDWSGCAGPTQASMMDSLDRSYLATTENLKGQMLFLRGEMEPMLERFAEALQINPEDQEPWEYTRFYLEGKGFPAWI